MSPLDVDSSMTLFARDLIFIEPDSWRFSVFLAALITLRSAKSVAAPIFVVLEMNGFGVQV
jgi:hypothetical protein